MKNKTFILFASILIFSSQFLIAKSNQVELGARYLKLGNTYRVLKDFDLSKRYLIKGKDLVQGKSKYWTAVSYEYLGYYYYDTEKNKTKAIENLNEAQLIYRQIINQKDGSQEAIASLLDMIQFLYKNKINDKQDLQRLKDKTLKKQAKIKNNNLVQQNSNSPTIINLDRQKLKELPSNLPENLSNLSLSDNKFRDFPTGLYQFKKLQFLNLSNNKIRVLPDDINLLKNLEFLDLSNNKIKIIPSSLSQLKNLKFLNLKRNKISFTDISNLIRALPNTNILFDQFIRKPDAESGDNQEFPLE